MQTSLFQSNNPNFTGTSLKKSPIMSTYYPQKYKTSNFNVNRSGSSFTNNRPLVRTVLPLDIL
jgi:hypothetical protein